MSERDPDTTGHCRLLWVEAETPERELKARALEGVCEVEFAPPGEPALAAVRERRPDAVLARAEEGGLEFLRELREIADDPRIRGVPVLLAGDPESEECCLSGMEEGACDFLIEPFSPRTLAIRVAVCMRSVRDRRESLLRERELLAENQMAAEALGRSEERFQAFLRNSPVASWMTDEEGRVVFLSEPYTSLFGIPNEDAVGRSVFEIYPAAFAQTFYDNIRAVAETGGSLQTIEAAPRPDGGVGYFLVHKFPVPDETGRLLVGGVAADVTEMKRNEEALRESEERFRLATEAVSGMIYDWSLDTDRVQRSLGLQGLLGYWPEENISQVDWWRAQVHPDDAPRVRREVYGAIEEGRPSFSVEYRVRHRDGRYIHAWDKGLIVRDAQGRAVRVVGSTIDISDRKRAQEELERAHQEAKAANEAKDHFLATLSHELRTPLTPVLAVLSSLEADPRLAGHAGEIAMIRRNVELEARLIDDLLDLTRVTRGKLELHRRETDARQVIEHAVATIGREIEERGLTLSVELLAEEHRLWADAPRLTQVFWNLLSNAVKFTPPGGKVTVRSWTEMTEPGRFGAPELAVEVRDTGIGIEPDVLPRIFDAFEQTGRRITRKFGGLGLGLAVSRAIVDLHGGKLTAASEGPGRGAAFTVRLPLGGIQEELEETGVWFPRTRSGPGMAPGTAERPLSILLVEDHPDTAEAMADLLRLSGHQVTVAGSVASGLAAAEAGAFDLLLSDLGLPDGSGQDLMRELGRRYQLKGIALSGYGMEDDIRRSHEAGFARHLTKPVNRQALETTIRQVVQGS
ncbi:MAG TPA: PAS domain S-box protein [Thermoanaerobaculia bacterium]|jgi:PAS domain S-box-containing protein|nr:PAS domain S-box protein [Thermoanaerobaculia bacterium]